MAFGEDRTVRRRRLQVARLVAAVVVMCAAIVGGFQTSQSWAAGDQPAEAEIIAKVDPSGRLDITQRFTFKDGAPAKISEDIATSVDAVGLDNTNYRYEISDVKASIGGQPMNPDVSTTSTHVTIALATSQTKEPIEITYSVVGAANAVERVTSERHTQV